jgi:hypothetical protein
MIAHGWAEELTTQFSASFHVARAELTTEELGHGATRRLPAGSPARAPSPLPAPGVEKPGWAGERRGPRQPGIRGEGWHLRNASLGQVAFHRSAAIDLFFAEPGCEPVDEVAEVRIGVDAIEPLHARLLWRKRLDSRCNQQSAFDLKNPDRRRRDGRLAVARDEAGRGWAWLSSPERLGRLGRPARTRGRAAPKRRASAARGMAATWPMRSTPSRRKAPTVSAGRRSTAYPAWAEAGAVSGGASGLPRSPERASS